MLEMKQEEKAFIPISNLNPKYLFVGPKSSWIATAASPPSW